METVDEASEQLEDYLKKFSEEVVVSEHWQIKRTHRSGDVWVLKHWTASFRNQSVEVFETNAFTPSGGWLASLVSFWNSLENILGIVAVEILSLSKVYGRPSLVYVDKHLPTGKISVTAEWYSQDMMEVVDMQMRDEVDKAKGFSIEKMIGFEEVVEEAVRFLTQSYGANRGGEP